MEKYFTFDLTSILYITTIRVNNDVQSFQPIDNKRDQFRKYLEASGVIEVLSKSITKLMEIPEKPESPVEFIRENIGLSQKELHQIKFLKEEVEVYKKQVNDLKIEIAGLKFERQEVKDALSKEVVPDATVKDEILSENQSETLTERETQKTEDAEPTPVLVAKTTDDVPKVDISNDVQAEVSAVAADVADVKTEAKPDEIKSDDKPSADVAEPTDK